MTQTELANHLNLSLKGVRNMMAKLEISNKTHTHEQIRKAYIASLDDAGDSRSGQTNITKERVKLMQAQRIKLRLETKKIRNANQADSNKKTDEDSQIKASDATDQQTNAIKQLIKVINRPMVSIESIKTKKRGDTQ